MSKLKQHGKTINLLAWIGVITYACFFSNQAPVAKAASNNEVPVMTTYSTKSDSGDFIRISEWDDKSQGGHCVMASNVVSNKPSLALSCYRR